jgi:hypothetical protein
VSRRYDYAQSVIGDCGHLCHGWPQLSKLGSSDVRVICTACTIAEYGLDPDVDDSLAVWVRVAPDKDTTVKKPKKSSKKTTHIPQHDLWGQFL